MKQKKPGMQCPKFASRSMRVLLMLTLSLVLINCTEDGDRRVAMELEVDRDAQQSRFSVPSRLLKAGLPPEGTMTAQLIVNGQEKNLVTVEEGETTVTWVLNLNEDKNHKLRIVFDYYAPDLNQTVSLIDYSVDLLKDDPGTMNITEADLSSSYSDDDNDGISNVQELVAGSYGEPNDPSPTPSPSPTPIPTQSPTPPPGPAEYFSIGGTVTGLKGTLVLEIKDVREFTINFDGLYQYDDVVQDGDDYEVTISHQPAGQLCTISNRSGVATTDLTAVNVQCEAID